jgi:cytoskeletal protein CcmA (bactofilin family)
VGSVDTYRTSEQSRTDVAHIGKSVVVKGELSGSEDLYVDGEVEGSIELHDHNLTVGPNGRIRANVNAKEVVIHGRVDGNVTGTDRVELRKSAVLAGDIATQRIVIEDGAYFKGGIDIRKDQAPRREQQASHSTTTPVTPVTTPSSSPVPAAPASSTRG